MLHILLHMRILFQNATIVIAKWVTYYKMCRYYKIAQNSRPIQKHISLGRQRASRKFPVSTCPPNVAYNDAENICVKYSNLKTVLCNEGKILQLFFFTIVVIHCPASHVLSQGFCFVMES